MATAGAEQENSVVWICAARGVLSDIVTWLERGELYTSSSLTNLIPLARYKATEVEGRWLAGWQGACFVIACSSKSFLVVG
ncbi:unnamed protein product [Sphagnum troendelagicum]